MNFIRGASFSLSKYQIRGTFKQQLNEGDTYANFQVKSICKSRDFHTIAYELNHIPTNLKYTHFANSQINNQAMLLFHTPPEDESGIVNIVQEMCNSGSDKYPVRDTWFHMHGRSLQPYDMTPYIGPDYTVFQIQSMLQEDFYTLINLTFEQVLRPMFREVDFLQQFRLQQMKGQNILRGNLYTHMQKQWQDIEFIYTESMRKHMLKGSYYQYTSGGIPINMLEASFNKAKLYFDRFVNISKAHFVTSGDIDILQNLQKFDELFSQYPTNKQENKILYELKELEPRLNIQGIPQTSFAFRGPDIKDQTQDYLRLTLLSYLIHDIYGVGLTQYLDKYQAYAYNYGSDTNLKNMIFSIGFKSDECVDDLYKFIADIKKDFYQIIPKEIIQIAFDRIKLRRNFNISDLIPFIIHDVRPQNYLNQILDIDATIDASNRLFSQDKVTVEMTNNPYYIEQQKELEEKYLKSLKLELEDYQNLAKQQSIIDSDNTILSLQSLPQLKISSVLPILKEEKQKQLELSYNIKGSFHNSKFPQQTSIQWIINIQDFSKEDIQVIHLIKDLLLEFFNMKQSANDLESSIDEDKLIFELVCLDKNINNAFQESFIIIDPPFDDIDMISQSLSIISSTYVNPDITKLVKDYAEQQTCTLVEAARFICGQEIDILRSHNSKRLLKQLSSKLIASFFKLMNKNNFEFKVYSNPYFENTVTQNINLMLANLKIQFEGIDCQIIIDFELPLNQFNEKYEIDRKKDQQFKHLRDNIQINIQGNVVSETFKVEHDYSYLLIAKLLQNQFMPQYCLQQQTPHCFYNKGYFTMMTSNDVNNLKSYQIFENSIHILIDCLDDELINYAKIQSFQLDPELMSNILVINKDQILNCAKTLLSNIAEGTTAQVIFGEAIPELIEKGWKLERFINDIQ